MRCELYFGIFTAVAACSIANCALIDTSQGPVRGKDNVGLNDVSFVSYMGIPYAKQPIGELRFQPPQDPELWDGVLDGTTERSSCIQLDDVFSALRQPRVPEDEACLYLNVHVSSTKTTNKAVLIFIHGGGCVGIWRHGYIWLGLFGFLCLDIPEAPGNLAGRDMAAALRWVRRNIAAFGGDPDNVTVGGHSAGAASAQFVALSPLCKGLFKRVVIMGGGAFSDWAIGKDKNSAPTMGFARKMNISETNPIEVLKKLKSSDAQEITKAGRQMSIEKGIPSFKFVVEERFDGVEAFLAEDPEKAITRKYNTDIYYMIGFNNREGIFIAYLISSKGLMDYYNKLPELWIPHNILSALEPAQIEVVGIRIKKFFIGDEPVTENNIEKLINYCSSSFFYYGTVVTARLRSSVSQAPVYVYQFSYDGDYAPMKATLKMERIKGVSHGDELPYIFKLNSIPNVIAPGSEDTKIRDKTLALWTNFIKNGNPTPEKNDLIPVKWHPTNGHNVSYYNIDKSLTMEQRPDDEAVQFWDKLYQEYAPNNYISGSQK